MNVPRTLDGRCASLLLAGGALNGLAYRIVEACKDGGSDAPLDFFGVSPFEFLVGAVAARLLWSAEPVFRGPYPMAAVALYMVAMLWPSSLVAWLLTTALAAALVLGARGPARSGALLFAALGAWEIWSAVLEPAAAKGLLALDADVVARILSTLREDVVRLGNVVGAADGHRIVVLVGCSTAHFLPLALLGAAALLLVRREPFSTKTVLGLGVLAATLGAMNLTRLTLMAWSDDAYRFVHGPSGAMIFDALTSALIVFSVLVIPTRGSGARG